MIKTKKKILEETERLFFRYGIRNITMDDIARQLTISKKTLYEYFHDKDELVYDVLKAHIEIDKKEMSEAQHAAKDALEEIVKVSEGIKKDCEDMNPYLLHDLKRYYPNAYKLFSDFKDKYIIECIISNLERGIREGVYQATINVPILAKLRIHLIETAFNQDIFPADEFKTGEVHLQLLQHFLHGIVTLKGHKLLNKYMQIHEED